MDRGERGEQEYDVHLFEFWIFGSGFRTNREGNLTADIRPNPDILVNFFLDALLSHLLHFRASSRRWNILKFPPTASCAEVQQMQ